MDDQAGLWEGSAQDFGKARLLDLGGSSGRTSGRLGSWTSAAHSGAPWARLGAGTSAAPLVGPLRGDLGCSAGKNFEKKITYYYFPWEASRLDYFEGIASKTFSSVGVDSDPTQPLTLHQ
jgi:hypothetical protein